MYNIVSLVYPNLVHFVFRHFFLDDYSMITNSYLLIPPTSYHTSRAMRRARRS